MADRDARIHLSFINYAAGFVPRRRMRKLHVGLFGYSRNVAKVRLPPKEIKISKKTDWCKYKTNEEHKAVTSRIIKAIKEGDERNIQEMIVEASHIRKFLG